MGRPVRLDTLLVKRGLAASRARARALIESGEVLVDGLVADKPSRQVRPDQPVRLKEPDFPWVGRGALKLLAALDSFPSVDPTGTVCADLGSSTGGFTEVLLSRGASKVYAIDVGTNQLAWKLRQDDRVTVHEQTSARILTEAHITRPIDIVVCDASFIALDKVLPVPMSFAKPGAWLAALIKPQFEVGKDQIGKGGVVRDPALHAAVCDRVMRWLESIDWPVTGLTQSPITGPSGNIEFLVAAQKGRSC